MEWFDRKILLIFASSSVLWQITFVGCELAILRFIDPELIGIWQLALLIQSYSAISRLGIMNAMNREFPFYLGQANEEKAKDIHTTAFSYVLINGLVLTVFFMGLAFYFRDRGVNWMIGFSAMAIIVLIEFVNNYFEATLRAVNKFKLISIYQIGLIPIAILTLLLPWKYDFFGLCIRATVISISQCLILFFLASKYLSFPRFQIPVFKDLFNVGWRLWIWNYLKNIAKSLPRVIIASFSGTTLLGLYAPVNWMSMAFTSLSGSISAYIYPNLSFSLAKKSNSAIGHQSLLTAKYTLLIFTPMTIVGILLLPYCIPWLLPEYSAAIPAMQVSLVAGLFESVNLSTTAFATLKAWKPMFYHVSISIFLKGILVLSGYFLFDDKLLGIVIGVCIASIIMFGITWKMVSNLDNKAIE
ncbi:MAG: oligosaccharide flippase family protein [Saprospiraceae bacterium]|nr:oligosaccharide flippase family protein [Saprospiraceae bacterium]